MSLTSNIKDKDWVSVRQATARLSSSKLGPTSTPTFLGVTTTSLTITGLTTNALIYPVDGLLTSLSVASDGQLPIGSTGVAPVLSTITATANETTVANGAGSITVGLVAHPIVDGISLIEPDNDVYFYSDENILWIDEKIVVAIVAGNPIGLLLSLTYPATP